MGDIGQIIKILPPDLADKLRLHTLSFSRLSELRLRVGRNVTLIYDNKEIMYDIKVTKDCPPPLPPPPPLQHPAPHPTRTLPEPARQKCGPCLAPGCPAMVKQENGIPKIDAAMCNGCELCAKRCKFHAIELIPREKGGKA